MRYSVPATPLRLSAADSDTETVLVYQPFCPAVPDRAIAVCGAVLSIRTVTTLLGSLTLPATSVTVTAAEETAPPSADSTWSAGVPDRPDRLSALVKRTVTSWLYQPLPLAAVVAAALTVG